MRLWRKFDGEPFLDNPSLMIMNPRKRRLKHMARKRRHMKRDSRGRFLKKASASRVRNRTRSRKRYAPRRRRTARATIMLSNPRKRRSYARNPRRHRRYRRNAPMLSVIGFNQPMLKAVGFTVLGVAGTPFVEGFVSRFVPATWAANKAVSYGVKFGSAYALHFGVKSFFGREAGRATFVGGLAYIALCAIKDFAPGLLGTGTAVSSQPLIGEYPSVRGRMGMGSYITENAPDRLRAESRF